MSEHGMAVPQALTRDPLKREAYAADTYFQETFEQLVELGAEPVDLAFRHGLLLLKPDAVVARQLLSSLDWLDRNDFRVVSAERVRLTPNTVRALWYFQWNLATSYRRRLADLFTDSVDSLLLVVRADGEHELPATVELTGRKGPTDPDAREPGQLRHDLGRFSFLLNQVHTTDEPADVIRELGVQLDLAKRKRVIADMLSGRDRAEHARELAGQLYAEAPARDLRFATAATRLRGEAERIAAQGNLSGVVREELRTAVRVAGEDGLRMILETAWRHGLELGDWDVVVVGSAVFPMKVRNRRPLLGAVTVQDWCSAPAAPQYATGEQAQAMDFSRTFDKATVHRAAIAEVFVTSAAAEADGTYRIGVQVPRHHGFYADVLHPCDVYDPMFFLESCRQAFYVLAHEFHGVPMDRGFILRGIDLEVLDAALFATNDAPIEAVLHATIEHTFRDRERHPVGLRVKYRVLIDGKAAAECGINVCWVPWEKMLDLRRKSREALGLSGDPVACPAPERIRPELVNRRVPLNVVISGLSTSRLDDNRCGHRATVIPDTTHPSLFDHQLDHVPGMVELEACRQTAVAGLAARGSSAPGWRLDRMSARFREFAELDLPIQCEIVMPALHSDCEDTSQMSTTATITQGSRVLLDAELCLTRSRVAVLPAQRHPSNLASLS
jgi:nucleoside diphosphate kinase